MFEIHCITFSGNYRFKISPLTYYDIRKSIELMYSSYHTGYSRAQQYLRCEAYNNYSDDHSITYTTTYYNLHNRWNDKEIIISDGGLLELCRTIKDFENNKNIVVYEYWNANCNIAEFYYNIRKSYFDTILSSGEYNPDEALQKSLQHKKGYQLYREKH